MTHPASRSRLASVAQAAGVVVIGLVCLSVSVSPAAAEAVPRSMRPVLFPDLGVLEPAVAAQLEETQDALVAILETDDATLEETAEAYSELARLYHAYGLLEPAETCYLNALQLVPENLRWTYLLGTLYQTSGRLEEASHYYQRVLPSQPQYAPLLLRIAEVLLAQGQPEEAKAYLTTALDLEPSSAAVLSAMGQVALSARDYLQAIDFLKRALALVPEANRLHYALGQAYRGIGDLDKARYHLALRGEIGVRPRDSVVDELEGLKRGETVYLLRGRSAFRVGRYAEAVAEFRRAVEAAPESVRARVNLGTALAQTGDLEGAILEFRRALVGDPDNRTAHFNLGSLLADQGEYGLAVGHLQVAVDQEPTDAEAHLQLAESLRELGRLDEALAHYGEAIALEPRNEFARLGQAETLVRWKRYGEARERLEEAIALLPESGLIAHGLARLLAACPELSLRDGERALDLALRVYQGLATVRHAATVAEALAELGRCEEAVEWQGRALAAVEEQGDAAEPAGLLETLRHYQVSRPCRPPGGPQPD